jgi:tetratricopeptide (TPR) repeat protein
VIERIGGELAAAFQAAAQSEQPPDFARLTEQVLAIAPADVAHPDDAARLLHLLVYLAQAPTAAERAWGWARALGERHPADAKVIAIRAQLGDILRSAEGSPLAEAVRKKELEAMFRRSMELDPQWAGSFRRAGAFFLGDGNEAEAERCLARAFRLDRSDARVASQLAEVYAATDRPGDALAVLDMCLREGTESPDLLWQAGTWAAGLGRHESTLTYLDRLEQLEPGRPWVHYYRAVALLALGRPAEAADAAELEAQRIDRSDALHLHSIRAAAAAQAGRGDDARRHLQASLAAPLGSIEDLTITGITSCHERLWQAALALPEKDGTRLAVVERLLASGLTPEGMWEWYRGQGTEAKDLTHYLVDLRQPLGPEWPALPTCPPGWGEWQAYVIRYGVLAASEDEARDVALKWQARSSLHPAEVLAVEVEGGPYKDCPGVTWRTQPAEADDSAG